VGQHIEEREDNKRMSLILVDSDPKMAKAGALQRVREVKAIDRRNVPAGEDCRSPMKDNAAASEDLRCSV